MQREKYWRLYCMKVVRSDRFLIIYVENRSSVYKVYKSTKKYFHYMKVVRSDRFLITCVENRELNVVRKSTAVRCTKVVRSDRFLNTHIDVWNFQINVLNCRIYLLCSRSWWKVLNISLKKIEKNSTKSYEATWDCFMNNEVPGKSRAALECARRYITYLLLYFLALPLNTFAYSNE